VAGRVLETRLDLRNGGQSVNLKIDKQRGMEVVQDPGGKGGTDLASASTGRRP